MIIALASPRVASSFDAALAQVDRLAADAAEGGASIVCFPEAWLPGLRGLDFEVLPWDRAAQERAVERTGDVARRRGIAIILGTEDVGEDGRRIAAVVLGRDGAVQGWQMKTQIDPSEDAWYLPGSGRRLFEVDGVPFGITTCHEGWRYPETVRWAAVRGAKVVFHLQHTGSHQGGTRLVKWGSREAPYYEKAMVCRAVENAVWFASVNYCLPFQESATSIIAPSGECRAWLPYGVEGVLVHEIDLAEATGHLAARYAPERYGELR